MDPKTILSAIEVQLQAHPPTGITPRDISDFVMRNRPALLKVIDGALLRRNIKPIRIVEGPIKAEDEDLVFRVLMEGAGYVDVHDATGSVDYDCNAAARRLQIRVGERMRGFLVVGNAFVHPDLRREGRGLRLYRCALREAARRGYALAPHRCLMRGDTSPLAEGVWTQLKAHALFEGTVLWGGLALEAGESCGEAAETPTGEPTPWGGRRGPELDPAQAQEGHRVVTARGEHGVVTRVMRYRWRQTGREDEISYHFDVRLDSGRETSAALPLYQETAAPTTVIPDISFDGGKSWSAPETAWSQVVQAHRGIAGSLERARRARKATNKRDHEASARRSEKLRRERFAHFRAWREAWPQATVEGLDPRLYRLFELEEQGGALGSAAAVELAQLGQAPEDWRTRWTIGDRARYFRPGQGSASASPTLRGTLTAIEGHHATLDTGDTVPLWMLHFDPQAGAVVETFDEPRYLIDLAQEMLASTSATDKPYPDRAAVARAVKAWLAEQGMEVRTRVGTGSMVTSIDLYPPHGGAWSDAERERLQVLAPGLSVYGNGASLEPWQRGGAAFDPYADYGGKGSGLSIPPEHIPRFAALLAKAMQAQGQALSAVGERRLAALAPAHGGAPSDDAAQASGDGCIELSFELPGHGRVRVVCGQQGRRDVWHNLWVGSTRYGFNGRRWARHQVPPAAVLEAVAERGITVFKGGR